MADSSHDSGMDEALSEGQVEQQGMLQSVPVTTRSPVDVPSATDVNKEAKPAEAQKEEPSQSLQSCLSNEMEENESVPTSCSTTQQENPPVVPCHQEVSTTSTSIASRVDSTHDTVEISPRIRESQPDAESTKEIPSSDKEQAEEVDSSSTRRESEAQDKTPFTQRPVDPEEPMEISHEVNPADARPALETSQETLETMDTSEPSCQKVGEDENEYAGGSTKFPVETKHSKINQSEELESEKSIAQVPVDEGSKQQTQRKPTDTQVCLADSQSKGDGLAVAEKASADVESTSDATNQRPSISSGNDCVLLPETEIGKDDLSIKSPPDGSQRDGISVVSRVEGADNEVQNAVTSENDPFNQTVQDGSAAVRPLNEDTLMDNPSSKDAAPTSSNSAASFLQDTGNKPPQVTTPNKETAMLVDGPSVATVKEDTCIEDPTMDEDAGEEDDRLGSENKDAVRVDGPSVALIHEDADMCGSGVTPRDELAVMADQTIGSLNEDTKNTGTTATPVDEDEAIVGDQMSGASCKKDASSLKEDAERDSPLKCATKDSSSVPSLNEVTGTDGSDAVQPSEETGKDGLSLTSLNEDSTPMKEDVDSDGLHESATKGSSSFPPLNEGTGKDDSPAVSLDVETGKDGPSVASLTEDSTLMKEDAETDGTLESAAKDSSSVPSLNEGTETNDSTAVSLSEGTGRDSPSAKEDSGRDSPSVASTKGDTGRDSPSVASGRSTPSTKTRRRPMSRDSVITEAYEQKFILGVFPAENLFEYQWPPEKGSEWYFVQEQVCEFLQVKSFKRKYPDLERRVMDSKEKEFLRERGVVSEEQVTLGLTALRADEVYDLMLRDAPDKSAEYARVLHEKEKQNISNKHKQYEPPVVDSNKVQEYIKKAVRQAADYNTALMAERREERLYYFDMQTLTVQMPASKMKKRSKESTKLGPYPVAVIPGQYQNYYNSYTSDELKYFPLSTALYGPMAPHRQTDLAPPQTDADILSDNDSETVLSTDALEYSSESEDGLVTPIPAPIPAPIPMEVNQSTIELQTEVTAAADISLASEPPVYKPKDIPDAICGLCLKDSSENKMGMYEKMIHCSQCDNSGHPSCLDMNEPMVEVIETYPWQCMECKTCFHCGDPTHEDKMMFCDMCDRGYHTFCVGLQDIPTGLWACESCQTTDDTPAALEPHVPSPPPSIPTPSPEESAPEDRSSTPVTEATPTSKKRGRKSGTPGAGNRQTTPGGKRKRTSTPTPKRVKTK
ncbi:supporter of activation of yellow protein-like isoform X2 [Asterias rubens]|uniref:supporter of activation of yellow protein-like isoform X2 n=1 Tax=Asterias rubens TaxID=7604 RepID=UPI001454E8A1|nr:supporter of activation of yellow protein-like isoform X2 [Asterias rubens]